MITYFIENSIGEVLSLSSNNVRREPLSFKPEKRMYAKQNQFGSISRGTFKQGSKEITLMFNNVSTSIEDYYYTINRIAAFLYNQLNAPFYLYSVERKKRCKVSISDLQEAFVPGNEASLGLDSRLILTMEDAFFESISDELSSVILDNGESFTIDIRDDSVESGAIFEITNLSVGDNVEFALLNENGTFRQNIIITPTGFSQNKKITLDCFEGSIKLEDQFISNSIIAGNYFPLLPGSNKITYECPEGKQVQIDYTFKVNTVI